MQVKFVASKNLFCEEQGIPFRQFDLKKDLLCRQKMNEFMKDDGICRMAQQYQQLKSTRKKQFMQTWGILQQGWYPTPLHYNSVAYSVVPDCTCVGFYQEQFKSPYHCLYGRKIEFFQYRPGHELHLTYSLSFLQPWGP